MVFEHAEFAGAYLGRYLAGGQLEHFLKAADRSWKALWVSPVLLHQSGWSLERCQWVRQGWHVRHGTWQGSKGPFGGLTTRRPSWWFRANDREWVLSMIEKQSEAGRRAGAGGSAGGVPPGVSPAVPPAELRPA